MHYQNLKGLWNYAIKVQFNVEANWIQASQSRFQLFQSLLVDVGPCIIGLDNHCCIIPTENRTTSYKPFNHLTFRLNLEKFVIDLELSAGCLIVCSWIELWSPKHELFCGTQPKLLTVGKISVGGFPCHHPYHLHYDCFCY